MRTRCCVLALIMIGLQPLSANGDDDSALPNTPANTASEIEVLLETIRTQYKLPALAGAIVTPTGVKEVGVVGYRKLGDSTRATKSDLWHLGSCTKAMTATLIGLLVKEEKLSWDTTLAEIFPEEAAQMDDHFRKINMLHLLTHRSGLPANGAWHTLGKNLTTTQQRHELLRRMIKIPMPKAPGDDYLYSNVGYAIAGLAAETVTGKAWETLMRERIFEPLGMNAAGFGVPGMLGGSDQPWAHQATWLGIGPLKPVQLDNAESLGPAGTVHASMESWGKFIACHLRSDIDYLPAEIWERLHTPPVDADYACGWTIVQRPWAGGTALTHSGSNTVNYCVCWLAPKKNFAVIAATNSGLPDAALALDKVASELIRRQLSSP